MIVKRKNQPAYLPVDKKEDEEIFDDAEHSRLMIASIYTCRGWLEPVSAEIQIDGPEEKVNPTIERIVNELYDKRELYYCAYLGSYSSGSGISLHDHSIDTIFHEGWHQYVDQQGLSTTQGMPIEEASALVIEEYATRNELAKEHCRASVRYTRLYPKLEGMDQQKARKAIIRSARKHSYDKKMRENPDKRISPWAYMTDELKYLLLYKLCHDLTRRRKGLEWAKEKYIEALHAVKESGDVNEGIKTLKQYATRRTSRLYDFILRPIEEDTDYAANEEIDGVKLHVNGEDRDSAKTMLKFAIEELNK